MLLVQSQRQPRACWFGSTCSLNHRTPILRERCGALFQPMLTQSSGEPPGQASSTSLGPNLWRDRGSNSAVQCTAWVISNFLSSALLHSESTALARLKEAAIQLHDRMLIATRRRLGNSPT